MIARSRRRCDCCGKASKYTRQREVPEVLYPFKLCVGCHGRLSALLEGRVKMPTLCEVVRTALNAKANGGE